MRRRIVTALSAAAIGVTALAGTASASEGVEVCHPTGTESWVCVRVLEPGAVVGVTVCQGIWCFERNVPPPTH